MEHNCQNHEDVLRRVETLEEDVKTLFVTTSKAAISQGKIETKLDNILVSMGELKACISDVTSKPAKRWDLVITTIITSLIGVGIGIIAGNFIK